MTAWSQLNYRAATGRNYSGSWTSLGSNGSSVSIGNYDNANSSSTSIGFNFTYNGTTYTDFIVNSNGFIKLGTSAPSGTSLFYSTSQSVAGTAALNSTNSADDDIISVLNHDLEASGQGTTEIRYETTGSSPSRVCTIEWMNFRDKTTNPAIQFDNMSFQIKLFEDSNKINDFS